MQKYIEENLILGTLGNDDGFLTCSMDIARRWKKYKNIKPYPEFEKAAIDVKSELISCLLVPAAYPNIKTFIMDNELIATDVFIKRIPALVLAGVGDSLQDSYSDIYYHPATYDLVTESNLSYDNLISVKSNLEACEQLLCSANNQNNIAVTNELCAEHFQLNIYKTLRKGIKMPWICFEKNISEEVKIV